MARFCKSAVIYLSLIISCSIIANCDKIYEDRENCPTVVYIDYSKVGNSIGNIMLWLEDSNGEMFTKRVSSSEFGHLDSFHLKKGDVKCFAWGNVKAATMCITESKALPATLLVKQGEMLCDSLYFFKAEREIRQDTALFVIYPCKQFATIFLSVIEIENYDKVEVHLNSSSRGFFHDGRILQGQSSSHQLAEEGITRLRLLRQSDLNDLSMELVYMFNGETYSLTFDLGNYLQECKYDMNALNMSDIYLTIDIIRMKATLRIGDWMNIIDIGVEI